MVLRSGTLMRRCARLLSTLSLPPAFAVCQIATPSSQATRFLWTPQERAQLTSRWMRSARSFTQNVQARVGDGYLKGQMDSSTHLQMEVNSVHFKTPRSRPVCDHYVSLHNFSVLSHWDVVTCILQQPLDLVFSLTRNAARQAPFGHDSNEGLANSLGIFKVPCFFCVACV